MKINFNPIPSSYQSFFEWKKSQTRAIALVCIALVGVAIWQMLSRIRKRRSFLDACERALEERSKNYQKNYGNLCKRSNCECDEKGQSGTTIVAQQDHCKKALAIASVGTFQHRYLDVWSFDRTNVYASDASKYYPANYLTEIARGNVIAAQGPTKQHAFEFLQMLINVDCKFLVVVADDLGGLKYEPYVGQTFKNKKDKSQTIEVKVDTEIYIDKKAGFSEPFIIKRQIRLKQGEKEHEITQFQLANWQDHKSIDPEILYKFVMRIMKQYEVETTGTLVTHCSAGVGRTGVFAYVFDVIWDLQQRLSENEFSNPLTQEFLDQKFLSMRDPKTGRWPMMIQTAAQYQNALQTILHHVKSRVL